MELSGLPWNKASLPEFNAVHEVITGGPAPSLLQGTLPGERGHSQPRWVWTAAVVGPLAIPLLYLADAASAIREAGPN